MSMKVVTYMLGLIKKLFTKKNNVSKQLRFEDDEIFLLSRAEFERYCNVIPTINIWWYLRTSASYCSDRVKIVESGSIYVPDDGVNVNIPFGPIRPALRYSNLKSKIIKSDKRKDRFIFNDVPFIIIDEKKEIAIAELPITFDVFDEKDNYYANSYIRKWLLNWLKEGKK